MDYLNNLDDNKYSYFKNQMHKLFHEDELNMLTQANVDKLKDGYLDDQTLTEGYIQSVVYNHLAPEADLDKTLTANDILKTIDTLTSLPFVKNLYFEINDEYQVYLTHLFLYCEINTYANTLILHDGFTNNHDLEVGMDDLCNENKDMLTVQKLYTQDHETVIPADQVKTLLNMYLSK